MRSLALFLSLLTAAAAAPSFYTARVAPVFDRHCITCHGPDKQKAKLRLDTLEFTLRGAEAGPVVKPGDVAGSELYRRITLPRTEEEAMPSDGKPALAPEEVKVIELWIRDGASATRTVADFPDAPAMRAPAAPAEALAPDWRPRAAEIAVLERETGLRLVPRSQVATDGLVVRTASAPVRANDEALGRLAPIADLIVEAELARTKVSDAGLAAVGRWENLRRLDLTRTAISSRGVAALSGLARLEVLNLTDTAVDDDALVRLKLLPALKRVWLFGTKCSHPEFGPSVATR